jgi:hypothetical protein
MHGEDMRTIRLDDRIQKYKSFIDYDWAKSLADRVRGTNLESPVLSLLFALKATANSFAMPYFMMNIMTAFEEGFLQGRESMPEEKLRLLAEALPMRMAQKHGLPFERQRQFSSMIDEILHETREAAKALKGTDINKLFSSIIKGPGGAELQLGVVGLCQICFGATFHAYEHFLTECIRWAKADASFKVFKFSMLTKEVKNAFGEEVTNFCLTHDQVQIARAVRNSLAHNGGKYTSGIFGNATPEDTERMTQKLHEEYFVENDEIRVIAQNNIDLFELVKDRVSFMIDIAVKMPQFH